MADTPNTDRPQRLAATPARQGRMGRDVLVVLVVSLSLALLAVLGSWVWYSGRLASTEPSNAQQPASRTFQAPEPAPLQNAPTQAPAGG